MKNNLLYFFILQCFFYLGCLSKPIESELKKFPIKEPIISNDKSLKIYFPQLENENHVIYQGDGIVVIFPNNEVMVIDGFVPEASDSFIMYLNNLSIKKIDYLIATHYHGDHIGSFSKLISNFEIGKFYSNGAHTASKSTSELIETLKSKNISENVLKADDILQIGEVQLVVYSPSLTDEDLYNAYYNPGKTARLVNNTCLVFKIKYNKFSVLFTGDINKNADKKMCKRYKNELQSNILKLPHHGDYWTASSYTLISTVKPDYGIICDSKFLNKFYWNHRITSRYSLYNVPLLYKNTEGTICVESDGSSYNIYSE